MNVVYKFLLSLGFFAIIAGIANTPLASAQVVRWERINGILLPLNVVGGFMGVGGPWTAKDGKVKVDLASGHIVFHVKGLVLAFQPPAVAPGIIGTSGIVTEVRGTLVCDAVATAVPPAAESFVDTPAVPLTAQGDAKFEGTVPIPAACLLTPNKLAFLIRVANSGIPITDSWNAHGAVRVP